MSDNLTTVGPICSPISVSTDLTGKKESWDKTPLLEVVSLT